MERPENDRSLNRGSKLLATAMILSLAVFLPQFFHIDFFADDWFLLAAFENEDHGFNGSTPGDLFRFHDGDAEHVRQQMDRGPLPWFTHPEFQVAFWRPLSSAWFALQHRLFGHWPHGYALTGLLLYLALVVVVALVLRRLLPLAVSGLATIIFAMAATHLQAVGWIAAHNALLTALFGLASLHAHLHFREDGWGAGRVVAPLLLTVALLSGEAALGALAYLAAYELVGAKDTMSKRATAFVPHFIVAVLWFAAYHQLGYGTNGSGSYLNPFDEPLEYLVALPQRLAASSGVLFGGSPADLWFLAPALRPVMTIAGALVLLLVAPTAIRGASEVSRLERRSIHWLALGMLGALLPQMAGMLSPRSYMLASFGASAVVALLLHRWWTAWRSSRGWKYRLRGAICAILAVIHLGLAPLSWFAWAAIYARLFEVHDAIAASIELDPDRIESERIVILSSPDVFSTIFVPFHRVVRREPLPEAWWVVSLATCDHRVHRTAVDTLQLEFVDGRMMETSYEILYRHASQPLRQGDVVELTGMRATVVDVDHVGPTRVELHFDRPLDDPSLRFLGWLDGRLRRVEMPAVGQTIDLPWENPL